MKEEDGHGDWLQSNEDLDQSFDDRKRQSRAMVVSTIDAANTPHYSDLKSVYTVDTVIGVSEDDYRRGFASVEELKQHRSKAIVPLQREQAEQLLSQQEEEESRIATERAFRLLQEEKVNQKKEQSFWSQLLRLQ